ncbi:MAG: YceI family protein [bacterium]|nr:YceI family protein [bacterium]
MAKWVFDKTHSFASFSTRHMMVTTVRGQFTTPVEGWVEFDPANIGASAVEATIDAASINTGVADRDNHLRSADFLDVANYPTITFKSTRVEPTGADTANIHGDLTIRGTTRPVVIAAEFLGTAPGPFDGKTRAGFSGTTSVNREEFGLVWNVALETGGVLVGKDIKISLDVEVEPAPEAVQA